MIRFALSLLVILLPTFPHAQTVVARSGEHGDFTRLVFSVPTEVGYDVVEAEDGRTVRVELQKSGLEFELDQIFDRINKNRIQSVEQVPGESVVEITLNCSCDHSSFTLRESMIVLDFSDSSTTEDSVMAVDVAEKPRLPESVENVRELALELSDIRIGGTPSIGPVVRREPLIPTVNILRPGRLNDFEGFSDQSENASAFDLSRDIASSLARATTEGLLDPTVPEVTNRDRDSWPNNDEKTLGNVRSSQSYAVSQLMEVETFPFENGTISIGANHCTPNNGLNISEWSSANSVLDVMADGRRALFGEFDDVNSKSAQAYVQSLLHFGFGAEARAALQAVSDNPDPILWSMSYLLDGEVDPTGWFAMQANCDGYAAFWAALSGAVKEGSTHYNAPAIIGGMENLPQHLRGYLGQHLATKLSAAGKSDIAKDVLRRLERLHGGPTDRLKLGVAAIEAMDGNFEEAEIHLSSITALPEEDAPHAITTSVEIAHAKQEPVSREVSELTAAYASELRDSPLGPDLWKAQLRTLLLDKNYDESFRILSDGSGVPDRVMSEMHTAVMRAVVENAADIPFLKYLMGGKLKDARARPEEINLKIVRRLVSTGLSDVALDMMQSMKTESDGRELRVLRASALLDLGKPEQAEIHLVGLRGDVVDTLRAEARQRMGDHNYARELYEILGDDTSALKNAWLSSDWARVAENDDTALARAARLIEVERAAPEFPSLEYVEGLTSGVAESRATLRALLAETSIDP
ncbi:hypothetical protein [Pacificoceanicola onchidii]|uniref:hypothetical protein n=1 Tax=Pacificoceanicola onchidii TaxID=2562685 RepID=UPI0010A6B3FD|nr:hypothetical protein [Pacificoceanicola onchidii]